MSRGFEAEQDQGFSHTSPEGWEPEYSSDIEQGAESGISAPAIGGNCFSSDFWTHQNDLMHAGAASNPDMAATTLALKSYGMGAQMAQEIGSEAGLDEGTAIDMDASVGSQFQEARRIDHAATELGAGNAEGAAVSTQESRTASGTAKSGSPGKDTAAPSEGKGVGEAGGSSEQGQIARVKDSFGAKDIDRLLASVFGEKKPRKLDCKDCSEGGVDGPAESPAAKSQTVAKQEGVSLASFFQRKSQQG